MHNYNVTLVHWHHTLRCQCSSLGTYAVHKVVPIRVLIATKLNYFMTSLRGKNEVEVKFENSMHNYNVTLVHCIDITHWDVNAVVLVLVLFTKWGPSNNQNITDGRTDGNLQSNSRVHGLHATCPKINFLQFHMCNFTLVNTMKNFLDNQQE